MSGRVTIHVDESGTPGFGVDDDGLFVVGCVAILGDPSGIADAWGARAPNHKGRKLTKEEMLDVAAFLATQGVRPITSHCRLEAEDQEQARTKAAALEARLHSQGGTEGVRAPIYLWALQVTQTVVSASLGSLPFVFGEIDSIEIHIDQFPLPLWLRPRLDRWVRRWYDPSKGFRKILDALEEEAPGHPDIAKIRERVAITPDQISVVWTSRGPLHKLADAVAAIYRRKLQGEQDALEAWGVLEARYRRDGRLPACMGINLGQSIREALRRPVDAEESA